MNIYLKSLFLLTLLSNVCFGAIYPKYDPILGKLRDYGATFATTSTTATWVINGSGGVTKFSQLTDSNTAIINATTLGDNTSSYFQNQINAVAQSTGTLLKLDQTTPQSIINGAPTFGAGLNANGDVNIDLLTNANSFSITGYDSDPQASAITFYNSVYGGGNPNIMSTTGAIDFGSDTGKTDIGLMAAAGVSVGYLTGGSGNSYLNVLGGTFGIGTANPTQKFGVFYGNMLLNSIDPTTFYANCTVSATTGSLTAGDYSYKVSIFTTFGETMVGAGGTTATSLGGDSMDVEVSIPSFPDMVGFKVYRTAAGASEYKLAYTFYINDPTTFNDGLADESLGDVVPAFDTAFGKYFGQSLSLVNVNDMHTQAGFAASMKYENGVLKLVSSGNGADELMTAYDVDAGIYLYAFNLSTRYIYFGASTDYSTYYTKLDYQGANANFSRSSWISSTQAKEPDYNDFKTDSIGGKNVIVGTSDDSVLSGGIYFFEDSDLIVPTKQLWMTSSNTLNIGGGSQTTDSLTNIFGGTGIHFYQGVNGDTSNELAQFTGNGGITCSSITVSNQLDVIGTTKIRLPYGTFYSTTTQTCAVINTTQAITLDGVLDTHGISFSSTCVIIVSSGEYFVSFSALPTGSVNKTLYIFPRINNTNVANSNTPWKFAANDTIKTFTVTYIFDLNVGDKLYLIMYSDDTNTKINAYPATTTPVAPASPSIIFTVNKLGEIQ